MNKVKIAVVLAVAGLALAGGQAMAADAAAGGKTYNKKCKACHGKAGAGSGAGPSLLGIVGRQAGTSSFKRFKAFKGATWSWSDAELDALLTDSKKYATGKGGKGMAMAVKLKKADERADVIAYLKTLK